MTAVHLPESGHSPISHVPGDGEVPAYHEPDFDRREVQQFGSDDGEAVTVIGKLLVSFFLYSLLVMLAVGFWTWTAFKASSPTPTGGDATTHAEKH